MLLLTARTPVNHYHNMSSPLSNPPPMYMTICAMQSRAATVQNRTSTMMLHRHSCGTRPSPRQHSQRRSRPCATDTHTARGRPLAPSPLSAFALNAPAQDRKHPTHIHEHKARNRLLILGPPSCCHCTRSAARVDKELALHFICLKLVRAAPQQDVHVHLSRSYQQAVAIPRWYDGVPMREAYAERPMCDYFR